MRMQPTVVRTGAGQALPLTAPPPRLTLNSELCCMPNRHLTRARNSAMPSSPGRTGILYDWPWNTTAMYGTICAGEAHRHSDMVSATVQRDVVSVGGSQARLGRAAALTAGRFRAQGRTELTVGTRCGGASASSSGGRRALQKRQLDSSLWRRTHGRGAFS